MATNVSDVEFFAVLASAGTMTEAARHWGISVSVVSRRLHAMESRLGVQLAHRGGRRLVLTAEGVQYRDRGSEILQSLRDLESSINPNPHDLTGSIRLLSTVGLGRMHIAPILQEFRELHPLVDFSLELTSLPLSASVPGFDIAIHVGSVRDSSLTIRKLLRNRRIVVASPEYLSRHGTPRSLEELREHSLLIVRENEGENSWRFIRNGAEIAVPVRGSLTCNDGMAVADWCQAGGGLAMRSTWHVAPLIREGRLVQVLPEIDTPEADVVALFTGAARTPPRVRALVTFLRERLQSRCGSLPKS